MSVYGDIAAEIRTKGHFQGPLGGGPIRGACLISNSVWPRLRRDKNYYFRTLMQAFEVAHESDLAFRNDSMPTKDVLAILDRLDKEHRG